MAGDVIASRGEDRVDLVVVGSGAAGLTAAVTASIAGLKVIVFEHLNVIGGTSARSSGTVWVPDNPAMRAAGILNDRQEAELYLADLTGRDDDDALWRVFLDAAPKMVEVLDRVGAVSFRPYQNAPDYEQERPGAASGWRPLEPQVFDGRRLADDFSRLAWPLRGLTLFGGMMVTRGEAAMLLKADRSLRSFALGASLVGRYLLDRLSYPRGTRLVLGNALVARLLKTAIDLGATVITGARPLRPVIQNGVVTGLVVEQAGREREICAPCGVVLAGGGFPASAAWRARYLPKPVAEHTPASPGCDGSSIELGLAAGARLGPPGKDNALWFPSSMARRRDGSMAVYPHIVLDRAKPGLIAVNRLGKRFVNEAVSYHRFVRSMYASTGEGQAVPAWLVCDSAFIARYGLGLVRPRALSLRPHLASGYLKKGATIAVLAERIGIPASALQATVKRFNTFARTGKDLDFGRGETVYDRSNGDPAVEPNPCLGELEQGPFYAVAVYPTPLGTSLGLVTDGHARPLDENGSPIEGLYACGNDMQSAFAGEYPGAGAQLGQGMTFGWIAARHAAAKKFDQLEIIREERMA